MKKRRRLKKWVIALLIIINLIVALVCLKNIYSWIIDSKKTNIQINDIEKVVIIEETINNNDETLINPPTNPDNDYWNYIKLPFINVNFIELLEKNNDTVGFLRVEGTNINYPVVQAKDNEYYLDHSYDKSKNQAGWVFMDYRNNINDYDRNTIIYAHGRTDKTMFGSLKNILNNNWYKDTNNYIVKLSTQHSNTLWQIFSVYKIKTETYYLNTTFLKNEDYTIFLDNLKNRSKFNFSTELNEESKILTLSTCYDDNSRVVLHAVLIKEEIR